MTVRRGSREGLGACQHIVPGKGGEHLRVGRWVTSRRGVTNKLRDCPLAWYMVCAVVYCCTPLPHHPCIDRTRLDDNLVGRQTKGEGEPWRIGWLPTYCQRQRKSGGRGLRRIFTEHHQGTIREGYLLNIIQPRSVLMMANMRDALSLIHHFAFISSIIIVTLGGVKWLFGGVENYQSEFFSFCALK